jgi:hypothetical protein
MDVQLFWNSPHCLVMHPKQKKIQINVTNKSQIYIFIFLGLSASQFIRLFRKSYPNPQCWTSHLAFFGRCTVGPIGQKALNKVVSHTDTTLTLPDATRHYQTLPDATRRYQMLTDIIKLSNPTVLFYKLMKFRVKKKSSKWKSQKTYY